MATNFPASLDTLTNPTSTDSLVTVSHAGQHANANDAIEALQAKVGADNSAVATSLDYRINQLESGPAGSSITVSDTAPVSPSNGDLWFDSTSAATYVYYDSTWVEIGGATIDDPTKIENSIVDAKGDLITATADDTPARLPVGTNGQFLVADSGETTGLKWNDIGNFTTFTPTFTNLTIGNATVDFSYSIIGKMMVVNGRISFGSTTSITGTLGMTLPASATSARYAAGTIYIRNASIASYSGFTTTGPASTNLSFSTPTVSGSSVVYVAVDATTPFTLGGGDFILLSITLEIQ